MHFSSLTTELMKRLREADIILVEWETSLFNTLGCHLMMHGDQFFVVPDEQIGKACDIASNLGIRLADDALPTLFTFEHSDVAIRYILDDLPQHSFGTTASRLVFLPLSWTGISHEDIVRVSDVWTVPLPAACTAFVRIATRENHGSRLRVQMLRDLGCVMASGLFDTTYQGDYMELAPDDQPLSEKEVLELKYAVREIDGWTFKAGEEWIKEKLIDAVTGKINHYGAGWDRP